MVTQQIVAPPAKAAMFLVLTVERGSEAAVRSVLADVSGLTRSVSFRIPYAELLCVVGIGSDFWDRAFAAPKPVQLHPLEPIVGDRHTAVSTPGDLLIHLRASTMDMCFELARLLTDALAGHATIVDEVHGFRYYDSRDLLGFVDGTENPEGAAASQATLVGDEDPAYAGGSYVIVQKYIHDMAAWQAISTEEQERVIGRRKLDDVELDDDIKPSNSHVALNTITDPDGTERQIMRDNMPFGSIRDGEFGTYFIGYAADPSVTITMLENMFLGDPPGNYDRILDFSTALTGTLFFAPPIDFLDDADSDPGPEAPGTSQPKSTQPGATPEAPGTSQPEPATASGTGSTEDAGRTEGDPQDGSLRIGSLRVAAPQHPASAPPAADSRSRPTQQHRADLNDSTAASPESATTTEGK